MNKTTFRSFKHPLTKGEEKRILPLYEFLEKEFISLMSKIKDDKEIQEKLLSMNLSGLFFSQDFRETLENYTQKEYLKWPIKGSRSWYFRMVIKPVYNTFKSLKDKIIAYNILAQYDFRLKENVDEIYNQLKKQKIYLTYWTLFNISRQQTKPQLPEDPTFVMDWSTQFSQAIKRDLATYEMKIFDEWITLDTRIPLSIRENATGEFANPFFYKNKDNQLICVVPYEVEKTKSTNSSITLGIDLGKIYPFVGSIIYNDGSYSTPIYPTKETQNLSGKIWQLSKQVRDINRKIEQNEKLVENKNNPYLEQRIQDHYKHKSNLNKKIQQGKIHLSRLIARDISSIVKDNNVSIVNVENLAWVSSVMGGRWNYSENIKAIKELNELNGIKTNKINAKNTSKTNPFTDEQGKASNRNVIFENEKMDRDVVASLNIARRKKKGKPKKIDRAKQQQLKKRARHISRTKSLKRSLVCGNVSSQFSGKTSTFYDSILTFTSAKIKQNSCNHSFIYSSELLQKL